MPSEQTACHTHQHDYIFYVLEGFNRNEDFLFSFASNTGDAFAFKCQNGQLVSSDNKDLQVTATHSARNAGASRYREMLIETK